jgi:hypothetical protein
MVRLLTPTLRPLLCCVVHAEKRSKSRLNVAAPETVALAKWQRCALTEKTRVRDELTRAARGGEDAVVRQPILTEST